MFAMQPRKNSTESTRHVYLVAPGAGDTRWPGESSESPVLPLPPLIEESPRMVVSVGLGPVPS